MLGLITTLSTIDAQPPISWVQIEASTSVLINSNNWIKIKVEGTTDSLIEYTINKKDDRYIPFWFTVDQTNAQLQTLADVTANSAMITLDVFDGAASFSEVPGETAVARYFNVDQIVWATDDASGNYSRMLVEEGGFAVRAYIVDSTLAQIMDLLVTGTTTTTSTSSSSTTSTSTSSTSTTSTSTSSTSTSSTSSTSTTTTSA